MHSTRTPAYTALAIGVLMILAGVALILMYVIEAVVMRWGNPDQSLIFWYLPLLFMGLIGAGIGLGIGLWGLRRIR